MPRERQGREYIVGYQSEIRKGLWERVKTLGAPRIPASIWLARRDGRPHAARSPLG
jgi:hypothetical protein